MNLGKNVYNLLKRQPEVYVEGLGAFKRNHTPAVYDEKRNVYLPPITYIDFDRASRRGYDFIQYIQQLHLVDRKEAEQLVTSQVADLLERIAVDGQVKLDDLGHLVAYGDSYVFKALDLSGFRYEPVEVIGGISLSEMTEPLSGPAEQEGADIVKEGILTIADESLIDRSNAAETVPEPVIAEIAATTDPIPPSAAKEEVPISRNNTVWYVLMVVVALGIMLALYFANRNPSAKNELQTNKPVPVDSIVDEQADKRVISSLVDTTDLPVDSLAATSAAIDTAEGKAVILKPLVPADHTWQIVIGSHKTLAQAYEQAESYNKAGYPRVKVIPSNLAKNRKKVIWDSYATKEEADSALRYVQQHHIPDAWPDRIK